MISYKMIKSDQVALDIKMIVRFYARIESSIRISEKDDYEQARSGCIGGR